MKTVKLSEFIENPDNPSKISDEAFARLVGKLGRVPAGLAAKRIAYVVEDSGKKVVISGNKRFRALKTIHGDDGEVSADFFQDVSAMTAEQRSKFIIKANVIEGEWISEILFEMFTREGLEKLLPDSELCALLAEIPSAQELAENQELDGDDFADEMVLKLKLKPEDAKLAAATLVKIDTNPGVAFMKLIRRTK